MLDDGYNVDVICSKMHKDDKSREIYDGVSIFRLPILHKRGSPIRYLFEYAMFLVLASISLARLFLKKRYSVIQVHAIPEFLVFTAVLPKLLGAKIILDVQDPTRELFLTKYSCKETNIVLKLIEAQERLSFLCSDAIITPNIGFKKKFVERGLDGNRIGIIMNTPDERIFSTKHLENKSYSTTKDKFVLLFHGNVLQRYGVNIAIKAVGMLINKIPNIAFDIVGGGEDLDKVKVLVNDLKLEDYVRFHGYVQQKRIPEFIINSDVGVIPNRFSAFTNINLPQRIFEYAMYDIPVVITRTPGVKDYFDDNSLEFCRTDDPDDLAFHILELYSDPTRASEKASNAKKVCENVNWHNMKKKYLKIINELS